MRRSIIVEKGNTREAVWGRERVMLIKSLITQGRKDELNLSADIIKL